MIGKLEQVKVMFDCGGESSNVWGAGMEDKATFQRCGEGVWSILQLLGSGGGESSNVGRVGCG